MRAEGSRGRKGIFVIERRHRNKTWRIHLRQRAFAVELMRTDSYAIAE